MQEVKLQTCQIIATSDGQSFAINRGPGNDVDNEDDIY